MTMSSEVARADPTATAVNCASLRAAFLVLALFVFCVFFFFRGPLARRVYKIRIRASSCNDRRSTCFSTPVYPALHIHYHCISVE